MRWPRRRRAAWIVVLAAVLIVVGVLVWFQPHKLLVDQRVDEALPAAVPPGGDRGRRDRGPGRHAGARHAGGRGVPLTWPCHQRPGGRAGAG